MSANWLDSPLCKAAMESLSQIALNLGELARFVSAYRTSPAELLPIQNNYNLDFPQSPRGGVVVRYNLPCTR